MTKSPKKVRSFNKKKYTRRAVHHTKKKAKETAQSLRKAGHNARVINISSTHHSFKYAVYARYKKF